MLKNIPGYYFIKDWLFPHNKLKIRNVPRSWTDRSERVFHAVFSMLCDFVEKEHSYIDGGFRNYVKMADQDIFDHKSNLEDILRCYDWYTSIKDWDNPTNFDWENSDEKLIKKQMKDEEDFQDLMDEMLIKAIKTRRFWWT